MRWLILEWVVVRADGRDTKRVTSVQRLFLPCPFLDNMQNDARVWEKGLSLVLPRLCFLVLFWVFVLVIVSRSECNIITTQHKHRHTNTQRQAKIRQRQGKTRQEKDTRQDKTQDARHKTRQDKTRQDKARQDKIHLSYARMTYKTRHAPLIAGISRSCLTPNKARNYIFRTLPKLQCNITPCLP
jgi:hypothetical protein